MPKASDVLPGPSKGKLDDSHIWTNCPGCGERVQLDQANLNDDDPLEFTYSCSGCESTVLIVSTPGVVPWKGRGYRVGDWTVRNPSDLFFQHPSMAGIVQMPASPHALD